MSLSLTARYSHIAIVYTYHAGRVTRRVWDNHGMTPKTTKAIVTAAAYTIAAAVFVWQFLNDSEWSKDSSASPVQAVVVPDLTPTIEEIEQEIREIMPAPQPTIEEVEETYAEISADLNQFAEAPTPKIEEDEPIDYVKFAERYKRYNMSEHGMTQLNPKIEEQLLPAPWKPNMTWTKPDLVKACRCYGLSPSGNKAALLGRLQTALA